ncbi:sphingomyelin phosphodiesterase [Spartinivicinus ruber]|uniref:sphingomyelin phosphodiesterase n=1 Tax=Spartinivicinus ruber TaxID=2683272 RepID=UPI0013D1F6D3|nr:sphingomyelin phosphodiesterase [Spartinivicinus ruber]
MSLFKHWLLLGLCLSLFSQVGQCKPTQLQVMAYNIMQLGKIAGDWDQTNRLNQLGETIRQLESLPDVIVFNEVFTDKAADVLHQLADLYPYQTPNVGQDCSGNGWDSLSGDCSNSLLVIRGGVMLLSRYPIVEQHALVFTASQFGSWDYQSNKGAAYIKIERNGQYFHVLGTHLQAAHDDSEKSHPFRMQQLIELRQWTDSFGISRSEPVIVAGDMNVEFGRSDHIQDMLRSCQCELTYQPGTVMSYSAPTNWHTRANAYHFKFSLEYDDTLDYVMARADYRQPKQPAEMEVIPLKASQPWYWSYLRGWWSFASGKQWYDGYYQDISDHYPVIATFHY